MLFNESEKIRRNFVNDIVKKHVKNFFNKNLKNYKILDIVDASNHKDDSFLFMVVAQHQYDMSFAVWTSWNEERHSLNYGHYNLKDLDECRKVLEKYYYKCY